MPKLIKYTKQQVLKEAQMYLSGLSIPQIARVLKMPFQTVSWHLMHTLEDIDFNAWVVIRYKLLSYTKNTERYEYENRAIENSGISTDELYHQWNAIEQERRKKRNECKQR